MNRKVAMAFWLLIILAPHGAVQAQLPATASSPAQLLELLSDKAAWDLNDTAKFLGDGTLQLAAADKPPDQQQALRRVELPPATAWEAELRFSPKPNATASGLLLVSANGRWISVMLNPEQRGVQVSRGQPLREGVVRLMGRKELQAWTASGDQILKVRGDGGKVQVWLNGDDLGSGTPYDFEPQRVGVRSEGGEAQFRSLTWRAVGTDGRLARLSGSVPIPGRPPLMDEKFSSAASNLVGGLFGRLTGEKQDAASGDSWPKNSAAFTRDSTAKRLRLEGQNESKGTHAVAPKMAYYPMRDAIVAVTARVKLSATPAPAAAAGLYLVDRWRSGKPDDKQANALYAILKEGQLRLHQFNADSKTRTQLYSFDWPDSDKEVELRLVARGDRAWVFVDRRLVMSEQLRGGLALEGISGGGLRVEGLGVVEASSFRVDEL